MAAKKPVRALTQAEINKVREIAKQMPKQSNPSKSKTPAEVRDIQTRIKPRKLTKFEELLIKYKGDITKIPGWQGGRGTE
jgi:hypothetical protein